MIPEKHTRQWESKNASNHPLIALKGFHKSHNGTVDKRQTNEIIFRINDKTVKTQRIIDDNNGSISNPYTKGNYKKPVRGVVFDGP